MGSEKPRLIFLPCPFSGTRLYFFGPHPLICWRLGGWIGTGWTSLCSPLCWDPKTPRTGQVFESILENDLIPRARLVSQLFAPPMIYPYHAKWGLEGAVQSCLALCGEGAFAARLGFTHRFGCAYDNLHQRILPRSDSPGRLLQEEPPTREYGSQPRRLEQLLHTVALRADAKGFGVGKHGSRG